MSLESSPRHTLKANSLKSCLVLMGALKVVCVLEVAFEMSSFFISASFCATRGSHHHHNALQDQGNWAG